MKRPCLIFIFSIMQAFFISYMYAKGAVDGVARYKNSHQFQLTLDSMYRYGLDDGRLEGCHGKN